MTDRDRHWLGWADCSQAATKSTSFWMAASATQCCYSLVRSSLSGCFSLPLLSGHALCRLRDRGPILRPLLKQPDKQKSAWPKPVW